MYQWASLGGEKMDTRASNVDCLLKRKFKESVGFQRQIILKMTHRSRSSFFFFRLSALWFIL